MQSAAHENIYCGVVIINAILGGLNVLLITWLSRDRRNADLHKSLAASVTHARLDALEQTMQELACRPAGMSRKQ